MSMNKTDLERIHGALPGLVDELKGGRLERREFLRISTLLGLSATAAYALAGIPEPVAPAEAATGGTITFSMRVAKIEDPPTFSWVYDSNVVRQVCDYLTRTGPDNVTRPWLLESWKASDDLKTWTLILNKGIKWSNGDELTSDHVVWNISRWLDEKTGSSILGLFSSFLMVEYDTGKKDAAGKAVMGTKLWSDNAIHKVDDYTIQLNGKQAMLAVPESLFHYPALILHPKDNGVFGVGSIGTGPFTLAEFELGKKAVLKRRADYTGAHPAKLEQVIFVDLGDDPAAEVAAMASRQVDGMYEASTTQYAALQKIPDVAIHKVTTAQTAVARMQQDKDPFKDPRVRKAMRLAVDSHKILQISYLGLGAPGENHHVAPVHPDYYKLPFMKQNIAEAKKLLAEAGVPDGFECTIFCKKDPDWEAISVQAMVNMWKQIGVTVKMNVLPSAQYWDHWTVEAFAYTPWTHRPLGTMVLDLAYRTGVPWNESHYANPKLDDLLNKADATVDVGKRKLILKEIEELMQEEGPIVQPVWRAVFTGVNKKVKGFKMHPTLYFFCEEWSV